MILAVFSVQESATTNQDKNPFYFANWGLTTLLFRYNEKEVVVFENAQWLNNEETKQGFNGAYYYFRTMDTLLGTSDPALSIENFMQHHLIGLADTTQIGNASACDALVSVPLDTPCSHSTFVKFASPVTENLKLFVLGIFDNKITFDDGQISVD